MRNILTIGSGKMTSVEEFLLNDDGSCSGTVGMTMKWEGDVTDNGTKVFAMDGSDNVSASIFDLNWNKALLSFNDLSLTNSLKADNETYLCGESYWTGVEKNVIDCSFLNSDYSVSRKFVSHVRDNNTLKLKGGETLPNDFWCVVYGTESEGNYLYPECSSSSSNSGSTGGAGVWDQSTWDNSVFGD